jgi:hypothetical protein
MYYLSQDAKDRLVSMRKRLRELRREGVSEEERRALSDVCNGRMRDCELKEQALNARQSQINGMCSNYLCVT